MRILLIEPKYGYEDASPWIPIGKAYLAGVLRANGFSVKILDNALLDLSDDQLVAAMREYEPDVVATGGMTLQLGDMKRLARLARQACGSSTLLVGGGVHLTVRPEDGVDHFDFVVVGEGEVTLLELCQAYAHEQRRTAQALGQIAGLCFRSESGQIVRTAPRDFIYDLDRLPLPAYDLLAVEQYHDFLVTGEKAMSILTGRGCPYNCEFCASPTLSQRKVRYFSLDYTLAQIEHLMERYGCSCLRIMDDTFASNRKRVLDFCAAIRARGWRLNMTCLTHVKTCDPEMLREMKDSGFSIVALGIESGNDRILTLINKGISCADAGAAIRRTRDADLIVEALFMMGNIGETRETIEDSIRFARQYNPPYRGLRRTGFNYFQFATPFPGSRFFEEARDYGEVLSRDYDLYSHQEPVFIPQGLDAPTLIALRQRALKETNAPSLPKALVKLARKLRKWSARIRIGSPSHPVGNH
jgi:anaerobic magnesium-protoporphyrin IX monomethyl ester cyclase